MNVVTPGADAPLIQSISAEGRSAWWRAAWVIAAGTIVLVAAYWPLAEGAWAVWYSSPTYNHCFLIPLITVYLLWLRRDVFQQLAPRPAPWALVLLAGAAFVQALAGFVSILEAQQLVWMTMYQLFLLSVLGLRAYRALLFPLLYLFFMVPTGEYLVPWLQDFTAAFSVRGLELIGIPVYSDGVFITIPNGLFEVAEACAGLRFIIASVAFGFLFANVIYRSWARRVGFVVASLVVPIVANGFRALGIILIAHFSDNTLAVGVDHLVYGWFFFSLVTLFMIVVGLQFREDGADPDYPAPAPRRGGAPAWPVLTPLVGAAAIAIAAMPPISNWIADSKAIVAPRLEAVAVGGGWLPAPTSSSGWKPVVLGADAHYSGVFAKGGAGVQLDVAMFARQRHGSKLVSAENRFDEGDLRIVSRGSAELVIDGRRVVAPLQRIALPDGNRRLVVYFYWIGGDFTGSGMTAKLAEARTRIEGSSRAAALVSIAADYGDSDTAANAAVRDFAASLQSFSGALTRAASQ